MLGLFRLNNAGIIELNFEAVSGIDPTNPKHLVTKEYVDFLTSAIIFGTIPTIRLGSGTANSSTFLRGDSRWASPPRGRGRNGCSSSNRW